MPILQVMVVLIIVGLLLWVALKYIPMAAPFPQILTAVVVIFTVLWLLSIFGVLAWVNTPIHFNR